MPTTDKIERNALSSAVLQEFPPFHVPGAVGTYPLYLNAPTDGTITQIDYQAAAATNATFEVQINGTPINWTTEGTDIVATTTAGQLMAAASLPANTFVAGDSIAVEVTAVTGTPVLLSGQIAITVPAEDA